MTQIKVFESPTPNGLEIQVNTWLRDKDGKITIIKGELCLEKQYAYSILFEENSSK